MSAVKSPSVVVELADGDISHNDLDTNNNEVEPCKSGRRNSLCPEEFQSTRRKSSASRYGFDEAFVELVAKQCQLVLETENVLGRGSFGTVVSASYQGVPVAAKIIDTKGKHQADSVKNEEHALDLPPHPHVVSLLEIFQLGKETAIILLPRLRKGNLLSFLNKASPSTFTSSMVVTFAWQIASALAFCHSQGLLHLDLKPQNLLIDFQNNLRLSDFGNSRRLCDLTQCASHLKVLDGTVAYKAPELFCGECPTPKADVYSFGITLWQILERETPYFGENEHSIIYKVVAQGYRPSLTSEHSMKSVENNGVHQELPEIYKYCWKQEPLLRPDMDVVLAKLSAFQ